MLYDSTEYLHCHDFFYFYYSEAVSKVILFRKRCDAFFIALVSMVCFKDNSPPTKEVVRDLLSLLLFLKKTDSSASEKG